MVAFSTRGASERTSTRAAFLQCIQYRRGDKRARRPIRRLFFLRLRLVLRVSVAGESPFGSRGIYERRSRARDRGSTRAPCQRDKGSHDEPSCVNLATDMHTARRIFAKDGELSPSLLGSALHHGVAVIVEFAERASS